MSTFDAIAGAQEKRREFLKTMGAGVLAASMVKLTIGIGEAQASGRPYRRLQGLEIRNLDALGDVLLPGAAKAGISRYVDDQLASRQPLLLLKYVDYPGSLISFYRQGLGSLESMARARSQRSFHRLGMKDQGSLVSQLAQQPMPEWKGPPSPLFYFVVRNDAMDVCYGTEAGFAQLDVPYMAHIAPRKPW